MCASMHCSVLSFKASTLLGPRMIMMTLRILIMIIMKPDDFCILFWISVMIINISLTPSFQRNIAPQGAEDDDEAG